MPVDKFEVGKWYIRESFGGPYFKVGHKYLCVGIIGDRTGKFHGPQGDNWEGDIRYFSKIEDTVKGFIVGKWYKRKTDGKGASGRMKKDKVYLCVSLQGIDPLYGRFKTGDGQSKPGAWRYFYPTHYDDPNGSEMGEPTLVESIGPPDPPPPPTVEQPEDPELVQALRRFETGQMEAAVRRFLCGVLEEE